MHWDPLHTEFTRWRRARPDHPILLTRSRALTLAELDAAATLVAERLAREGVPPGACICLRAPNGPAFLALFLGLLRHGAVPVLLDSQTPPAEVQRVRTSLGAEGLLATDRVWLDGAEDETLETAPAGAATRLAEPSVIKLTSGSTGAARGIQVPMNALLADEANLAQSMGIVEGDRLLAAVPMAHSYGLSSLVVPALVRGATLLLPEAGNPFAPLQVATDLEATVFPTTPAYLEGLVQWKGDLPPVDSLRTLISAGAPLSPATALGIRKNWGHRVHAFYGASECGGIAYDREGGAAEAGVIGEPVANVKIELHGAADRPAAERRVVVRSAAVARGYLPDPDPRLAEGCFISEDLGSLDGGALRLCGRLGATLKIRGKKVHPAEVEQVLLEMPGVREAFVHAVTGGRRGQSTLEAVVVPHEAEVTRSEIIAWCRRALAPEKVPRRIVLVDRIPRNERGKIDISHLQRPRA